MNILNALNALLGGTADNQKTNRMVRRGLLPANQREVFPQRALAKLLPAGRPRFEDDALVNGPQGPVPLNADVAHFRGGMPQQGFGMQVQGVGQMQPQLQAPQTYWQNTDQRRRNMVNPQANQYGIDY